MMASKDTVKMISALADDRRIRIFGNGFSTYRSFIYYVLA